MVTTKSKWEGIPNTACFIFPEASGHINASLALSARLAKKKHWKVHYLSALVMKVSYAVFRSSDYSLHILIEFDINDSHVLKIQVPRLMMKGTPHRSCARIEMMDMAVQGTSLLMKD